MADMKKLGNSVKGRNKDGWPVQRQESRERIIVPMKYIGGVLLLSATAYFFFCTGFLLPG